MFVSRYMPCEECGASVERTELTVHVCDKERLLDFRLFHLRDEIDGFQGHFRAYLASNGGKFASWLAARQVRQVE